MKLPTVAAIDAVFFHRRVGGRRSGVVPAQASRAFEPPTLHQPISFLQFCAEILGKAIADDLDDLPELVRVAARLEPRLRRGFQHAVLVAQDRVALERLAEAVRSGRATEVESALNVIGMAEDVRTALRVELLRALAAGASVGAGQTAGAVAIETAFNLINAHAVEWAANRTAEFVTGMTETQRQVIRTLLADSLSGERDVRATARHLRETLGLTERQAGAVAAFRSRLAEEGIAEEVAVRRTERYAVAQLRYRARNVARTEVMDSANEGQQALWGEARARGLLYPQRTRRVWIATDDDRLDPTCERLDGEEATLDGTFPGGFARPPAHPSCRCSTGLRFIT